jgi:hypothetical protein
MSRKKLAIINKDFYNSFADFSDAAFVTMKKKIKLRSRNMDLYAIIIIYVLKS